MSERIESYEAFWPYYVSEHRDATCRRLHFVGTSLVYACLVAGVLASPWWLAAMPFAGYGFAWAGHIAIERNRPATFTHPLWSLASAFRMYGLWITGRLGPHLRQAGVGPAQNR